MCVWGQQHVIIMGSRHIWAKKGAWSATTNAFGMLAAPLYIQREPILDSTCFLKHAISGLIQFASGLRCTSSTSFPELPEVTVQNERFSTVRL